MPKHQERRSLAAALKFDESALAFIQGGEPAPPPSKLPKNSAPVAPQAQAMPQELAAQVAVEQVPPQDSVAAPVRRAASAKHRQIAQSTNFPGMAKLLVPLTTRLSPSTAAALKRAGLEQKLTGAEPSTVQQIAEIALQQWLQKNGFLI